MKIKRSGISYSKTMTLPEIPTGTVFSAYVACYPQCRTFLKAYQVIVSLDSPAHTWDNKTVEFKKYIPLEATLTVRPKCCAVKEK